MPRSKKIINREISWLDFNSRVLQEAADPINPIIDRIRFLGIFSNNQDEFFSVRVANVKRLITYDKKSVSLAGYTPKSLLSAIQSRVIDLQAQLLKIYDGLLRELAEHDIYIINNNQLNGEQAEFVKNFFFEKVYPALVPVMVSDVKAFPYLKDKTIYLAVKLSMKDESKPVKYSVIEIPTRIMSRFVVLPSIGSKKYIIILDDIIRYCLDKVYSILQYDTIEAYNIKVTRDSEIDLDNDVSKSLLEKMKKGLKNRSKGLPVRFVYDREIDAGLLDFLIKKMKFTNDENLIPGGRYHNFRDFMSFPNVGGKELEFAKVPPIRNPYFEPYQSILDVIENKDVLVHYPYQPFSHFIDLLREAAIDPRVKSIKITIYRLASHSQVVNALINAAKNGKSVTVVLELKARFDEENNMYYSNILQEEGVKVLFGMGQMKVHAKLLQIERKENKKLVRYCVVSTGNFNEKTSKIYTDVALFTSNKLITNEVDRIFDLFEKSINHNYFRYLVLSPLQMRNKIMRLINEEIKHAKAGLKAGIKLKINNLVDQDLINKLYEASNVGVKIQIIVRGICCLIPQVKGMSENIEAISILDKYLEHTRFCIFENNGAPLYYISSADWMQRNLDNRIEVTCPIFDPLIQKQLEEIFTIQWNDNTKARIIDDGPINNYAHGNSARDKRAQEELTKYYQLMLEEQQNNI